MSVQIQLRRGTAAQWTSANTLLAQGEIGLEYDTGKIKVGDGTLAWNSLAYFTGTGAITSVTGTSPVVSSGGTTPAISLASGYGDTQNPYASNTANYVLATPNGTAGVPTFRAIVAADIPTLNQNTTGTAANVTDSSNSTLATLSALSLPYSQLSGVVPTWNQNTTGTAANITASSNATLTTLSSLSLPGSQVSGDISGNAANVTGTVAIANGGTGQTTAAAAITALSGTQTSGRYLRSDGTNTALAAIVAGDVPTLNQNTTGTAANVTASSNSTLTTLSALSLPGSQVSGNISGNAANVTGIVAVANGGTGAALTTSNFVFAGPSSGSPAAPSFRALTTADIAGLSSGSVTSVALALPSIMTVSGSPVTSTGTLTGTLTTQAVNAIFAGPSSGAAAAPTFRSLTTADIPTLNQNTTGTAANVTGIVAVANGGSGTATPSLVAGTNVTVTGTWPNQTIAASGGGGGSSAGSDIFLANNFGGF